MSDDFVGIMRFFLLVLLEIWPYIIVLIFVVCIGVDSKLWNSKPLLHRDLHWSELFKAANSGQIPKTSKELQNAYRALEQTIKTRSPHIKHDTKLLKIFYAQGWAEVIWQESTEDTYSKPKANVTPMTEWRRILGVSAVEKDSKVIKMAYRKAVMIDHPDRGGNGNKIPALTKAIDEARKELRFV